jgi:hypothetical protein
MPSDLDNLKTRRTAIYTELAALDATKAGGKPNASGGSAAIDHVGYKDGLYRELRELNEQINIAAAAADGPWEVQHFYV